MKKVRRWFTVKGRKWHRRTTERGETAETRAAAGLPEFVPDCGKDADGSRADRGFQVTDKRPPSRSCCSKCLKLRDD